MTEPPEPPAETPQESAPVDTGDTGVDKYGDEIVPPGMTGARHVEQAFNTIYIRQAMEAAEREGRPLTALLLRRWYTQKTSAFFKLDKQIRRRQGFTVE